MDEVEGNTPDDPINAAMESDNRSIDDDAIAGAEDPDVMDESDAGADGLDSEMVDESDSSNEIDGGPMETSYIMCGSLRTSLTLEKLAQDDKEWDEQHPEATSAFLRGEETRSTTSHQHLGREMRGPLRQPRAGREPQRGIPSGPSTNGIMKGERFGSSATGPHRDQPHRVTPFSNVPTGPRNNTPSFRTPPPSGPRKNQPFSHTPALSSDPRLRAPPNNLARNAQLNAQNNTGMERSLDEIVNEGGAPRKARNVNSRDRYAAARAANNQLRLQGRR